MFVAVLRLFARLPLAWLHCAGAMMGWMVYWASPTYAARLRENLYASGVCGGDAQCRALLRAAIAETGKGVTELTAIWFGKDEKVAQLVVECKRWDLAEAARARGNGIIFLTPHLGCFEIGGLYIAQRMPLTALYRPPKKRWLEPLMIAGRSRWQAVVAPANLKGVRMLYKALARGEAVGLLPDQAPGVGEGVWADFFGRPAYTMTLVRRLQAMSGAAVIMFFAERLPEGRGYGLCFDEIPAARLDEAALNRAIEEQVRRCPAQYLWSYNRYKIPAGAKPPEF
ncbi:MAG: lysophospholipid acyltransferase family protein [Betaproteobacteria bacterium]|nr:lysophospholipid acyltransferase family protein [Betaproteobacteria bacterium]